MSKLKKFKDFDTTNEEVNIKSLAAGALLSLTSCINQATVDGIENSNYDGNLVVRKIEINKGKSNWFIVNGKDEEGKNISFSTDELTFNVGDSIHVDFQKEEAYPLEDKTNLSVIQNKR